MSDKPTEQFESVPGHNTKPSPLKSPPYVHPSAYVDKDAQLAAGVQVFAWCEIRQGVAIGENTRVGSRTLLDRDVKVGARVKIQTGVSIFRGVIIDDGAFIGPSVCFTNDKFPRAVRPDGVLKTHLDWTLQQTHVGAGASIGAGSVIVCGTRIGRWAMVGAGSVVTRSVPDFGLVYGNPARLQGYVCLCGIPCSSLEEVTLCPHCATYSSQFIGGSALEPQLE